MSIYSATRYKHVASEDPSDTLLPGIPFAMCDCVPQTLSFTRCLCSTHPVLHEFPYRCVRSAHKKLVYGLKKVKSYHTRAASPEIYAPCIHSNKGGSKGQHVSVIYDDEKFLSGWTFPFDWASCWWESLYSSALSYHILQSTIRSSRCSCLVTAQLANGLFKTNQTSSEYK